MRIGLVLLAIGLLGCGNDKTEIKAAPLTDEQKRQIKAADDAVDQEERSGSGTATKAKKRR